MKKSFSKKVISVLSVTAMLVSSLGAVEVLCAEETADTVVSSSAVAVSEKAEGRHGKKSGAQKGEKAEKTEAPVKAKGERKAKPENSDETTADQAKKERPAKKTRKPDRKLEKKAEKGKKATAEALTETTTTAE